MDINLAHFNTEIGRQKPENIIHNNAACPFCDTDKLTDIIAASVPEDSLRARSS